MGIYGKADRGSGVIGESVAWIGVYGESAQFEGVRGTSKNKDHGGVVGTNDAGGTAVYGEGGAGVLGIGRTWVGVYGETRGTEGGPAGVWADGKDGGDGVKGHANGPGKAGVAGFHLSNRGPGIFGRGAPAGRFEGNVEVTGTINGQHVSCQGNISAVGNVNAGNMNVTNDIVLANADCAEDFDVDASTIGRATPGTVMVLGDEESICPSSYAYDTRVVGVVSGGADFRPGIILGKKGSATGKKANRIDRQSLLQCRFELRSG
jgi:hypothetical protein